MVYTPYFWGARGKQVSALAPTYYIYKAILFRDYSITFKHNCSNMSKIVQAALDFSRLLPKGRKNAKRKLAFRLC